MNLVDSCGWLEYFADSPLADFYAPVIEDNGTLIVPTICILEVCKRVLSQRGEEAALQVAAVMHQGQVVPLDADIALNAAKIGSLWKLPLADSVILATARAHGALVWTQDAHFKGLENVQYIEKTNRSV
ncbi:type II toxin-antitoxin system VapC family toxin [Desulfoprunum benzoelyticum]|uniref:Putative nucleic acid-binding protein n=1 Tax=Desulfoprunum benzoelyticum TaxID=1506996 RepID=A0A840UZB3_9BACT|nr:type II toxin-antitoxin system VapC family toxin [Desulfoprunum benzoelyticum]MBB5346789.1 putative nucleic acid-binding protein [Desulfoprunum benzoelyticum]MBM9531520.1 type II toxin-antitoxin system VapC family toxin [Desulfoprunum benzoelyticum]